MKHSLSLALFALAALVCGSTFAQAPRTQDPSVAALKRDLVALQVEVAQLKEQVGTVEGDVTLQDVVDYLQAQAKSARYLQDKLADSEDKGFTWGINPDSRIVMLEGFNDFVNTLQTDVPGGVADDDEAGQ